MADRRDSNLTLNVQAHITSKQKNIASHVFQFLLDSYRTDESPYSALTGLKSASLFGRPNYKAIIHEFYLDMLDQEWEGKVGVSGRIWSIEPNFAQR